ncbi:hypothetical protein EGW08_010472, partial [Elysia chlorotica]
PAGSGSAPATPACKPGSPAAPERHLCHIAGILTPEHRAHPDDCVSIRALCDGAACARRISSCHHGSGSEWRRHQQGVSNRMMTAGVIGAARASSKAPPPKNSSQ